ncbi:MAG: hypothetical protein WA210_09055 [Burkholderiaceae bacterium]
MKRKGDPVVECIAAALVGGKAKLHEQWLFHTSSAFVDWRWREKYPKTMKEARRIVRALRRAGHLRTTGGAWKSLS